LKKIIIKLKDRQFSIDDALLFFVKPLFVIFIYYGMFSRFSGFLGLSGGITAALASVCLFGIAAIHFLVFKERPLLSPLASIIMAFFIIVALFPLMSSFIYNMGISHIFRFTSEIVITFLIFISIYYFIREGILTPKFFLYSIAILGTIASYELIINVLNTDNLRRVRGLGGLNYIGNTFAVSSVSYIVILYATDHKSWKKIGLYFGLIVVFMTMIFTGTRAAVISFVAGVMLFQIFGMKSRKFKLYVFLFGLMLMIPIFILASNIDMSLLLGRYSYEELESMAFIRFNIYYSAVADMSFIEFIFGRADLSAIDDSLSSELSNRYLNPHNVFLSLIRFNGILSFILFFGIWIILYSIYFKIYFARKDKPQIRVMEATIIIFLTMSFINVMFSGGKFTRNFYMYIAIGYAVGYYDLIKFIKSPKEYLKLIL